ncbi:asparaginase [Paenibacillus alba]|uniref:Asparaginase n=1 Tax=Paenibacillus alba TaxID=1197127 RepID=A0ABU6FYB8_9BACL|nr:asparaginase [Paenibacillus alba]MEC0226908.1 asparaginase [Paenibacillus alba]NQX65615.1 asparaginase [Paenibacillus alba]
MKSSNTIVRVYRGSITESIHRVHLAVVNAQGTLLHEAGDPQLLTFARSTAKLIQTLPVIESGAADHFGLDEAEIALCCASHNGEAEHVSTAQGILGKLGFYHTHLQCGAHEPFHAPTAQAMRERGEAPTTLHNNCSGKHSGMLTLSAHLGASPDTYMSLQHPVQQLMLDAVCAMSDVPKSQMQLGIDGCGVPVFGMPIRHLALAFARLGSPEGLSEVRANACQRIVAAVRKYPQFLAGSDRFDTRLIEVTGGRIIGKMGAEGIFALTIPEQSLGFVLKIEDGNQRAMYPAVVEALKQLNLLSESEVHELASYHNPIVHNWQGTEVGIIRPDFKL